MAVLPPKLRPRDMMAATLLLGGEDPTQTEQNTFQDPTLLTPRVSKFQNLTLLGGPC